MKRKPLNLTLDNQLPYLDYDYMDMVPLDLCLGDVCDSCTLCNKCHRSVGQSHIENCACIGPKSHYFCEDCRENVNY